ncbi:MAG: hypothetical protein JXL97_05185 [Bacteroidales bacterium]|nr:hypothetical protein [Bacteroidales bacterium]
MSAKASGILYPEKIHIIDTQIEKCSIECPFGFDSKQVDKYDFDLDFNLGFNLDDLLVKADFELNVKTSSKVEIEKEAQGIFHFVYIYQVENLLELAIPDKNKEIELNGNLGNALASITYSTSRGILFARLRGTGLENFILPVIDPNSLLKYNETEN